MINLFMKYRRNKIILLEFNYIYFFNINFADKKKNIQYWGAEKDVF